MKKEKFIPIILIIIPLIGLYFLNIKNNDNNFKQNNIIQSQEEPVVAPTINEVKEKVAEAQQNISDISNGSPVIVKEKTVTTPVVKKETQEVKNNPESIVAPQTDPEYKYYSITSVVDGDTVKINIDGTIITLRLIGLDTPETVDPRKTVQCFGLEASNKAKELLSGKKVRIEKDSSQGDLDKYGRTLAYIYREDGLFYNKYMIEQGYAHEYTYDLPYKYQTEFKNAQKTAQANLMGLWSPNTCNGDTVSEATPSPVVNNNSSTGGYYTSSYYSSKYYYPANCDGWKSLSEKYLRSYNSLADLLAVYPSKTESPQCE